MAFPYANRDYSLYSSTTDEASVGRAHHDLDKCAQILNEVLDNGAGILEGVMKRKSESPGKEVPHILHHKKLRQTNRLLPTDHDGGNIASSTPQQTTLTRTRRRRSASTNSVSTSSLRSSKQKRCRSLSEQRSTSACSRNRFRENRSLSAQGSRLSSRTGILNSVNSALANQSAVSSEADTLTGVHLDNSSQFGIPPVFNAAERRTQSKHSRARSRQTNLLLRRSNLGWLKPHATISTQTEDKENTQKSSAKKSVRKLDRNSLTENKCKQRVSRDRVTAPSITDGRKSVENVKLSSLRTSQKEHDVDELLQAYLPLADKLPSAHTKDEKNVSQKEVSEELVSTRLADANTSSQEIGDLLVERLRASTNIQDRAALHSEIQLLSYEMSAFLRKIARRNGTNVDQLLLPFQRESRELKEEVKQLKTQLANIRSNSDKVGDKQLSCDLSLKVISAETRNTKLSNQLADVMTELSQEKLKVNQLTADLAKCTRTGSGSSKQQSASGDKDNTKRRLQSLQQSMRLIHTMLTDIASHCELETAKHINPVLELCSRRLIESMSDVTVPPTTMNTNNNGRWENKPENLAELVSASLTRARLAKTDDPIQKPKLHEEPLDAADKQLLDSKCGVTQYFQKYHSTTGSSPLGKLPETFQPNSKLNADEAYDLERSFQPPYEHSAYNTDDVAPHAQLQSTLMSHSTTLEDLDATCSESVSTLSMATTMADNAFQDGLAKLDANIAKLQESLKTSRLGASL